MAAEDIGRRLGFAWRNAGWPVRIFVLAGAGLLVAMCATATPSEAEKPKFNIVQAPPDPAIAAAKQRKELAFQKTAYFAGTLKQSMRDPDSLVWEDIRANEDATVICLSYRARNGFGGMNREFAVYGGGKASQKPAAWNKYCTQPLSDMKHVRHALK